MSVKNDMPPKTVDAAAGNDVPEKKGAFKPKIVAFCCNWCSYAGADLAGSNRLEYPDDVKIIRIT